MSFKVTLGIMPDYAFDGVGLRIDDVTLNKPAALAGIQRGDIIIQMGNTEVKNMQDYMAALNNYNKGDTALVTIIRKGDKKQMTVSFLK
jgi:S1-C subfamily serine protease